MPVPNTSLQSLVGTVLRDAGPLTVNELLTRIATLQPLTTKNPKQTIRNALQSNPYCESAGDGRYVYLPTFIRGASVRLPMDLTAPEKGLLAVGAEVVGLLTAVLIPGGEAPVPALALEGGPTVSLDTKGMGWLTSLRTVIGLPLPFWSWWRTQQVTGADALVLRCVDGEAARFAASSICSTALDSAAVARRNEEVRAAAVDIAKRARGIYPHDLVHRLIAHGVYHGEPAPDPLDRVLSAPDSPLFTEGMRITCRPEITPALRRLLAPRQDDQRQMTEHFIRESLGLPEPDEVLFRPELPAPAQRDVKQGYRIKVTLLRKRGVTRVIEIRGDQTLDDLHDAIQTAFDWDRDHLYAFFLSGQAWDGLTGIQAPFGDAEPPTTDEVTLNELELAPGQSFLYIFDFGDEIRHQLDVLATFQPNDARNYPRIVESKGTPPPQYPEWDDD